MMVSMSKRSMFYICVASSSYHINNIILRHAGKFPLGLVHQKRPPQVPTKQCFPCILWKQMDLWGPFLGDQPKWKISMTWSFLTSLFPWGFGVLVKSFFSPRSTISKNRLCKANIRMRHWWQWRHWWHWWLHYWAHGPRHPSAPREQVFGNWGNFETQLNCSIYFIWG